jgi:polysaccharide biosynthesis protein PslG
MVRRLLSLLLPAAALCAAYAPDPAEAAPVSSHAMVHTCCTPDAMKERIFAEAAASGAEFIRVDVELAGIFGGGGGRPDWRALDGVMALAERHDIAVLGVLLGIPGWLSSCPERGAEAALCPPRDPAEFGRLAARVAGHARESIVHWEILNEPDADWSFKGTAADYARMLSAAYDAIHARVPDARVVMGGVERPREHAWTERMLATPGAGAARKFDVAALHLRLRLRNVLADLPVHLRSYRQLLAARGFRGPVWVTEHGYPADPAFQWDPAYRGGEAAQAAFLRDSIPALTAAGADQVFVTLRDNLWGEYLSEGIVHIDESAQTYPAARRPAFEAVRDQSGELDLEMLVELLQNWWL